MGGRRRRKAAGDARRPLVGTRAAVGGVLLLLLLLVVHRGQRGQARGQVRLEAERVLLLLVLLGHLALAGSNGGEEIEVGVDQREGAVAARGLGQRLRLPLLALAARLLLAPQLLLLLKELLLLQVLLLGELLLVEGVLLLLLELLLLRVAGLAAGRVGRRDRAGVGDRGGRCRERGHGRWLTHAAGGRIHGLEALGGKSVEVIGRHAADVHHALRLALAAGLAGELARGIAAGAAGAEWRGRRLGEGLLELLLLLLLDLQPLHLLLKLELLLVVVVLGAAGHGLRLRGGAVEGLLVGDGRERGRHVLGGALLLLLLLVLLVVLLELLLRGRGRVLLDARRQ